MKKKELRQYYLQYSVTNSSCLAAKFTCWCQDSVGFERVGKEGSASLYNAQV